MGRTNLRNTDSSVKQGHIILSNRDIFFCQTGTYYSSKGHTTLQKGHNALEKGHNALQKGHNALEKERNRGGRRARRVNGSSSDVCNIAMANRQVILLVILCVMLSIILRLSLFMLSDILISCFADMPYSDVLSYAVWFSLSSSPSAASLVAFPTVELLFFLLINSLSNIEKSLLILIWSMT